MAAQDQSAVSDWVVPCSDRVDRVLRQLAIPGSEFLSRTAWEKLFSLKRIRDKMGKILAPGDWITAGSIVCIEWPINTIGLLLDSNQSLERLGGSIEEGWLAFHKPAGVPSHPNYPWEKGCFTNFVAAYLAATGADPAAFALLGPPPKLEGGLAHRLDNFTSGALVVALNASEKAALRQQFSGHQVTKSYEALVVGKFTAAGEHQIEFIGGRDRTFVLNSHHDSAACAIGLPPPQAKIQKGSYAIRLLSQGEELSLVEITTRAGIRHQVRAALASLGFPLAGDRLYQNPVVAAKDPSGAEFHLLHAREIDLPGKQKIIAPRPKLFRKILKRFGI